MQGVASIERAGEQQRPSRSGLGDRPAIVGAIVGLGLVQHPGIARRFLIEAESGVSDPGERVEPLEAEQDKGEEVGDEVARTMVGKLMLERQPALMIGIEPVEIGRDRDHPVENSERHRAADFGRPDEADRADAAELDRVGEDGRRSRRNASIRATNRPTATPSQRTSRIVGQPPN